MLNILNKIQCTSSLNVAIKDMPYIKISAHSQNYWISGLCPMSGILNTRKHDIPETGSVSIFR
jgi:hypothetical protein